MWEAMKLGFKSDACASRGSETLRNSVQVNSPTLSHQILLPGSIPLSGVTVTQVASFLALPVLKARFIEGANQLSSRCLLSSFSII